MTKENLYHKYYRDQFNVYKKSKIVGQVEIWKHAEQYFWEIVLPLIKGFGLTNEEKSEILYQGFKQINDEFMFDKDRFIEQYLKFTIKDYEEWYAMNAAYWNRIGNERYVNTLSKEVTQKLFRVRIFGAFRNVTALALRAQNKLKKNSFRLKKAINSYNNLNKAYLEKTKASQRNILKPGDESYERNMDFCRELLKNKKLSKYAVVKNYVNRNPEMDVSEKSLTNSFDSFLKNHKDMVIVKLQIDEEYFLARFFPKKK